MRNTNTDGGRFDFSGDDAVTPDDLNDEDLVSAVEMLNAAYRSGNALIPDTDYDHIWIPALSARIPGHAFLHTVEAEPNLSAAAVRHVSPMLSMDKVFDMDGLRRFFNSVDRAAVEAGVSLPVLYKVMSKIDGQAGRLQANGQLLTRGNGLDGEDISHAIPWLQLPELKDGDLFIDGEIVVSRPFFENTLKPKGYMHARNVAAGLTSSDVPNADYYPGVQSGAFWLQPYRDLPMDVLDRDQITKQFVDLLNKHRSTDIFMTDGMVIEVENQNLRQAMGATNHHHRWRMAFKTEAESSDAEIIDIIQQVGRKGAITPVGVIAPTELSGAMVTRVTLHNINRQKEKGIGVGAIIEILRSGEVIPFVKSVLKPSSILKIPTECPCCGTPLIESGEGLSCPNGLDCAEQSMQSITHFFKTLGTANGFGIEAARKLHDAGIRSVLDVYRTNAETFRQIGFGPKTSVNMESALKNTAIEKVDDWRFLAAFGYRYLGRGASRLLLKYIPMETLDVYHSNIQSCGGYTAPEAVKWVGHLAGRIERIPNFGSTTAPSIAFDLMSEWGVIKTIRDQYMLLYRTPLDPAFYVETINLTSLDKTCETAAILMGDNISDASSELSDDHAFNTDHDGDGDLCDDEKRNEMTLQIMELHRVRETLIQANVSRIQSIQDWMDNQSLDGLALAEWPHNKSVEDWLSAWMELIPRSSWLEDSTSDDVLMSMHDVDKKPAQENIADADIGTLWDPSIYMDLFDLQPDHVEADGAKIGNDNSENCKNNNLPLISDAVIANAYSTKQILVNIFNELKLMPNGLILSKKTNDTSGKERKNRDGSVVSQSVSFINEDGVMTDNRIAGKSVVFTGAMDKPRTAMQAEAMKYGAIVQDRVTKDTDFLITGDIGPSSKKTAAEKKGVKVLDLDAYYAMFLPVNEETHAPSL